LTVLVGRNAAGKTNVLEAIMVTTTGGSFRTFAWGDLVQRGQEDALVSVSAERSGVPVELTLRVERSGSRDFSVNGRRRRRMSDVTDKIPVVSFVPEDLGMSKGPAEARRAQIDALGDRLSPAYSAIRIEYGRLVRQRNALLRQSAADSQLEPWDEMVAQVGAALTTHRARLLSRIEVPTREAYERVSRGEELGMRYKASWADEVLGAAEVAALSKEEIAEATRRALRERRTHERDRGTTLAGPHRDDIALAIDGAAVRAFASQGQHRTVALAWKMAEVAVVGEVSGVQPLLLLDDVMSELDEERREALAASVLSASQAVVTTTNLAYFTEEMLEAARVMRFTDE